MSQAQPYDYRGLIEKAIADFMEAARAKDAAKMASYYTEDATLMPPGSPPIKGRSDIQTFWQSFMDAGASDPTLKIVSVESSGDLACEIGLWEAMIPDAASGSAQLASGKYLVVWKRQPNGSLKMYADMFSPNS